MIVTMKLGPIIVACVGIVIAAGILIPTVAVCGPSKETGLTKARLSQVSLALMLYKQEYGDYPEPTDNQTLLASLGGQNPKRLRFYIPAENEVRDAQLIDAWEHPIHIRRIENARQLRSAGKDGILFTKDGILYTKDDILQEVGRPPQR